LFDSDYYALYKASRISDGETDEYECSIDTLPTDVKATFKSFDFIHNFLINAD
jgi:hypothetical protein